MTEQPGAFYEDLERELKDPEVAAEFAANAARIREFDARRNADADALALRQFADAHDQRSALRRYEHGQILEVTPMPEITEFITTSGLRRTLTTGQIRAVLEDRGRRLEQLLRLRIELAMARAGISVEQIVQRAAAEGWSGARSLTPERLTAAIEGATGLTSLQLAIIADSTATTVTALLGLPEPTYDGPEPSHTEGA